MLGAGPPPPRPDPWRRTSGIHRVRTRRGLAVVRELWLERDKIARRRDLSPTRVLPDAAIVEAGQVLPSGPDELTGVPASPAAAPDGTPRSGCARRARQGTGRSGRCRRVGAAGRRAAAGAPLAATATRRRPSGSPRSGRLVAALADEHHLPAENLLPPDAVRRLAWQPPEPVSRRSGRQPTCRATAPGPGRWA